MWVQFKGNIFVNMAEIVAMTAQDEKTTTLILKNGKEIEVRADVVDIINRTEFMGEYFEF